MCVCVLALSHIKESVFIYFHVLHIEIENVVGDGFCLAPLPSNPTRERADFKVASSLSRGISRFSAVCARMHLDTEHVIQRRPTSPL